MKSTEPVQLNSSIDVKEIPVDGMDLLTNKKKTHTQRNQEVEELSDASESEEELSESEGSEGSVSAASESGSSIRELSSAASSVASSRYDDEIDFEAIQKEKQELLFKLGRFEKLGYRATKQYTMDSKIEDIRSEFKTLKKQRELEKSIKFSREMLMAFVGGLEYLNGKFDPLDVKLEGWSESVMENINSYDEVFEELYDKYNEKVDVAPEIRLIMMVGGSAFMYHLTNSLFKSAMPNVNDILKGNPGLMANIQQATMNTMMGNQSQGGVSANTFNNMMNMSQPRSQPTRDIPTRDIPTRDIPTRDTGMRGPSGVDDILQQLHGQKPGKKRGINLGI